MIDLADFYREDGIRYMRRRPGEILTEVVLDDADGWRSAYWKLRRRGSFDFPVLSVAAAARFAEDGSTVEEARLVLGAVGSQPRIADDATASLAGKPLTDAAIEEASTAAAKLAKPMDNTDFTLHWRKRVCCSERSFPARRDGAREAIGHNPAVAVFRCGSSFPPFGLERLFSF